MSNQAEPVPATDLGVDSPDGTLSQGSQLALRDLLWLVTCAALLIAYARSFGTQAVQLAAIYTGLALVIGSVVGFVSRRIFDVLFWSCLATLLAYLAVAGGRLPNFATSIGWGSVGAVCGAYCGLAASPPEQWDGKTVRQLVIPTVVCAILGTVALTLTLLVVREPITYLMRFDIGCAALVGGLLKPFFVFLQWFEQRSQQPRIVLASWLTLVILFGNFLVPILTGVQR